MDKNKKSTTDDAKQFYILPPSLEEKLK